MKQNSAFDCWYQPKKNIILDNQKSELLGWSGQPHYNSGSVQQQFHSTDQPPECEINQMKERNRFYQPLRRRPRVVNRRTNGNHNHSSVTAMFAWNERATFAWLYQADERRQQQMRGNSHYRRECNSINFNGNDNSNNFSSDDCEQSTINEELGRSIQVHLTGQKLNDEIYSNCWLA